MGSGAFLVVWSYPMLSASILPLVPLDHRLSLSLKNNMNLVGPGFHEPQAYHEHQYYDTEVL